MTVARDTCTRISIADDHRMFVEALRLILERSPRVEVVSVAHNGEDLLRDVEQHKPEVVLVDISMDGPGYQGIADGLRRSDVPACAIALTMHQDRDLADRVIASGFCGYVVKDAAVAELIEAIDVALGGGTFVSRSVLALDLPASEPQLHLTRREQVCLEHVAEGHANRDIATRLGISERTVKFHLENIFRKLQARSRSEAVAVARRQRLISD